MKLRKNNWDSDTYEFDEVLTESASQKRVYEVVAKPVVEVRIAILFSFVSGTQIYVMPKSSKFYHSSGLLYCMTHASTAYFYLPVAQDFILFSSDGDNLLHFLECFRGL